MVLPLDIDDFSVNKSTGRQPVATDEEIEQICKDVLASLYDVNDRQNLLITRLSQRLSRQ